jgi:hypothetical protein
MICGVSASYAQTPPPFPLPTNNNSVAITTGGTFQQLLSAVPTNSSARKSLLIQNNNTAATNCFVFIGSGTATLGTSILLLQGISYQRYFPLVPSDVIQGTCATTGNTLYVDYQ